MSGLLSFFACCGGSVLAAIFGAGIVATLLPFGSLFTAISIITLMTGVLLNSKVPTLIILQM